MFPIVALWLLFIVSIAAPPLLLVSIPLIVWYVARVRRRTIYLRNSRDRFLEEREVLTSAKYLRS